VTAANEALGGSQGAVSTVPCRRTAVTDRGVALSCGGQDVLIPAKVSVQSRTQPDRHHGLEPRPSDP
jgi:hypothetical protein